MNAQTTVKLTAESILAKIAHGGGIDCDWHIEQTDTGFTASNYYHAMDAMGMYCGYVAFSVTIDAAGKLVDIDVNQDDVGEIEAEYANDDDDDAEYLGPCLYDLADYLYQTIDISLTE